jgi:hypothetical protein
VAGLDVFPKAFALEVLPRLYRVDRPFALRGQTKELDSADKNGASGRAQVVLALAEIQNDWTEAEHNRRQKPGAPEAHIFLSRVSLLRRV